MKVEIDTVKGFRDYLPKDAAKRKFLIKVVEKYFELYGFLPVETPIIEFDELMATPEGNQDEAVAERFKLQDRGGRNLGLRYEFTFQLARLFKMNPTIKLPFKRYQIGPVFRDEPTRTGRTRQFVQCDVDIIGDASVNADAECLALVSDILKELKVKTEIQVNNRKLLNALVKSVQINQSQQVLRELDKLDKLGQDVVKANLRKYASPNQIITLFRLLDKDLSFFKENEFEGAEELAQLSDTCKSYNVKLKFNPSMVRGFTYYTGNIFEVVIPGKKTVLMAGGRYDDSIGRYIGRKTPAVGISFSLEAIMGLAEEQVSQLKTSTMPKVLLISINQDSETIKLVKKLRKANVSSSISFERPGNALDYANSYKIPFVIFIGQDEVQKSKFKLRNMASGKESFLSEKQLLKSLAKNI